MKQTPKPGELPRLYRYVELGTLPDERLLAVYDESQNLMIIVRQHFERLSPDQQRQLFRSRDPAILIEDAPRAPRNGERKLAA